MLFLLVSILPHSLSASAQTPDSVAVARRDTTRADTLRLVPLATPPEGRAFGPLPANSAVLDAADALVLVPGSFRYHLGLVGGPDAVSPLALPPYAATVALDGLPFDDLFTGRPRFDLLPLDVLDRFREADGRFGSPAAFVAATRLFRAAQPVTELRYGAGQEGVQMVSATHAQTRRPPRFLGRGRLAGLFHVSAPRSTGAYAGGALGGYRVLGRLVLAKPGVEVEVTELHVRHTLGARAGVTAPLGGTFGDVFDPFRAEVLTPEAERETVHNTLAGTLRTRLLAARPLDATLFWTRQHARFTPGGLDTLEARGNRVGARLAQPFAAGRHRLVVRAWGWLDAAPYAASGRANPLAGAEPRAQLHAALSDSLAWGPIALAAEAGAHAVGDAFFPSASVRLTQGAAFIGARLGGAAASRVFLAGYDSLAAPGPEASPEQAVLVEAGLTLPAGPFRLALHGFSHETRRARVLVTDGPTAAFAIAADPVRRAGVAAGLSWREDASAGLYGRAEATALALRGPACVAASPCLAEALPQAWGRGRLGLRTPRLFGGALALDLALDARAWTAFAGLVLHAPTGLLALPAPGAYPTVPARGTLDVTAEAGLRGAARVFVVYENALAQRLYDGAYVVPVHPLPAHRLRFGVFWTLFG